jgi:hypothetical protein
MLKGKSISLPITVVFWLVIFVDGSNTLHIEVNVKDRTRGELTVTEYIQRATHPTEDEKVDQVPKQES